MGFSDEFAGAFPELAASFGSAGAAKQIVFNNQTADCTEGELQGSREIQMAGAQPMFDVSVSMLDSDFARLGFTFEDRVTVDGQLLRVIHIGTSKPLRIIGLSANR